MLLVKSEPAAVQEAKWRKQEFHQDENTQDSNDLRCKEMKNQERKEFETYVLYRLEPLGGRRCDCQCCSRSRGLTATLRHQITAPEWPHQDHHNDHRRTRTARQLRFRGRFPWWSMNCSMCRVYQSVDESPFGEIRFRGYKPIPSRVVPNSTWNVMNGKSIKLIHDLQNLSVWFDRYEWIFRLSEELIAPFIVDPQPS